MQLWALVALVSYSDEARATLPWGLFQPSLTNSWICGLMTHQIEGGMSLKDSEVLVTSLQNVMMNGRGKLSWVVVLMMTLACWESWKPWAGWGSSAISTAPAVTGTVSPGATGVKAAGQAGGIAGGSKNLRMNWEVPVARSEKKIPLEMGFRYFHCSIN